MELLQQFADGIFKFFTQGHIQFIVFCSLIVLAFTYSPRKRPGEYEKSVLRLFEQVDPSTFESPEDKKAYLEFLEKVRQRPESNGKLDLIIGRIEWDIAGFIGIIVTCLISFMVVAGATESIPQQLFLAWSTILGYYFGRQTKK